MTDNLQKIREACVAANPELAIPDQFIHEVETVARKFMNKVESGKARSKETYADMKHLLLSVTKKDFMRPIRLADVLLAMENTKRGMWASVPYRDGTAAATAILLRDYWNLRHDSLEEQDDATLAFIASLLGE